MLPPVTKRYEDHSTERGFRFAFYCDECGAEWRSETYPFSLRDAPPSGEGEARARELIWRAEHEAAYERANNEALLCFNRCHGCGRRVCDDCFSGAEAVCIKCEGSHKEKRR